jgi:hypothetical protein
LTELRPSEVEVGRFGLSDEAWDEVLAGLVRGEYALLLGAGASTGSVNAAGEPLPTGGHLGEQLAHKYDIPNPPGTVGLREIYDLADRLARRDGLELPSTYLRRRFLRCSVPGWYANLVRIPWKIIWNLNVDDVLDNAYREVFAGRAAQQARRVSWRDNAIFHREPSEQVSCVALHGSADKDDLVFGSLEYLATISHGGSGHKLFWDSWPASPTIVVGASLSDEIDMAAPLSNALPTNITPPSLVVLPDPNQFDRFRLESTGLLLVDATAEKFFAAVAEDWGDALASTPAAEILGGAQLSPNTAYFLQNFRELSRREDRYHDFFAGDEPFYSDIIAGRDARRSLPELPWETFPSDPEQVFDSGFLNIHFFNGTLSGSSTAELRFLHDLELAGFTVREYGGDAAFHADPTIWAFRRWENLVIRVPDLTDYVASAAALATAARDSGLTCRLVASGTKRDMERIALAVRDRAKVHAVSVPDKLSNQEIDRLIGALSRNDRLNVIRELSPADRVRFLKVEHRRSLFDGIAAATQGRSFLTRAEEEFRLASAGPYRSIAAILLIMAELRYALPIGILARVAGISAEEIAKALEDETALARIATLQRDKVVPRFRNLAARVSPAVLDRDRMWAATLGLARAFGPYISPSAIANRTLSTRFVAELMDADRVVRWFGEERADDWYQELHEIYSWNSRYWEQRSLAEVNSRRPRYEKAEAWAREALARHEDAFSLNTLGTVLLRRATAGDLFEADRFFEGLGYVRVAESSLVRPSEHPYVTALSYLRNALADGVGTEYDQRRLRESTNEWVRLARESAVWNVKTEREKLDRLTRRAIMAVAAPAKTPSVTGRPNVARRHGHSHQGRPAR